jgi:iron complex transport system substrate-binding protein
MTAIWPAVLLTLLLLQGSGCSRPTHEESGGGRTITDDLGRTIQLDTLPRRIVSLAPSLTESLFVLGADSSVAGVTNACNYPRQAGDRPVVGDLLAPNIERILALDADLVLISVEGNTQKSFEKMERLGIRLFVSNPRSMDGVCKTLLDIGAITGREEAAQHFVDSVRLLQKELISKIRNERPSVLMLVAAQPIMAAGSDTFLNEIIETAGGRNAAASAPGNYPTLSREAVLQMNPDLILFPDDLDLDVRDLVLRYPEWKHMHAVQENHLHSVDADIFLRPGPRVFAGAQQLHLLLHPVP